MVFVMGKLKVIVKRPLNHYLIIIIYILAPVINVLMVRILGQIPFHLVIRNFFEGFGLLAGLWLITAPIIGIGFYFVNRVSWYAFIGHSFLIIIDYIYKWASNPLYYISSLSGLYNALLLSGNIILMIIVGYVIQKNFRAPYFQALQRHWRESIRIPIHHVIRINSQQMDVDDLSIGGCFVLKSDAKLSLNQEHDISFHSDRLEINCKGSIMRQTDTGYGIMFKEISKVQRKDIQHFLKKRFSLRQQINLNGQWINNGISKDVTLLDISKGGCFIKSDLTEVHEKDSGVVVIEVKNHEHNIHGDITWINHKGEHKKPDGFGCEFNIPHKRLLKVIVEEQGKSELTR
jgi:Tfp pilus assembly protein PilZ